MDSEGSLFQTAIDLPLQNVPSRCVSAMPAQTIVAWTPSSLLTAFVAWLVAETPLTAAVQNDGSA